MPARTTAFGWCGVIPGIGGYELTNVRQFISKIATSIYIYLVTKINNMIQYQKSKITALAIV